MGIAKFSNFKTCLMLSTLVGTLVPTAAHSQSTYACFKARQNHDFVTFLKKVPSGHTCDVVRELESLRYASSKGPNIGFTSRIDRQSGTLLLDRPDAYSLGGNRLAVFKANSTDEKDRLFALSLDAMTVLSMPKYDSTGRSFSLPSSIRPKQSSKNPYISIDYGNRDYETDGRDIIGGTVDRDMCGIPIKLIDKPDCQIPGPSNVCMRLKNLRYCRSRRENISTVDAAIMRPLRAFDVKYDTRYNLSRENVTGRNLASCINIGRARLNAVVMQGLAAGGFSSKRGSIAKTIAGDTKEVERRFKKLSGNIHFSSYSFADKADFLSARTTTLHVYEFERCNEKRFESIFHVIDIDNNLSVLIVVSQPERRYLIANPSSYVNFLDQFTKAGFSEIVAQAAIIRISTMKKL